jgi:predicted permease
MPTVSQPSPRADTSSTVQTDRGLLAATGAAFAILVVVGNALYTETEGGSQTVGYGIELLGYVALAIFLAWVATTFDAVSKTASSLAVISGSATLAMKFTGWAAVMAAQEPEMAPDVAAGLVQVDEFVFVLAWLPYGLFVIGLALAARQADRLPRWVAWVGVAVGIGCIAAVPVSSTEPFVLPWMISLLWLIAASTLFVRGQRRLARDQRHGDQPGSVEV